LLFAKQAPWKRRVIVAVVSVFLLFQITGCTTHKNKTQEEQQLVLENLKKLQSTLDKLQKRNQIQHIQIQAYLKVTAKNIATVEKQLQLNAQRQLELEIQVQHLESQVAQQKIKTSLPVTVVKPLKNKIVAPLSISIKNTPKATAPSDKKEEDEKTLYTSAYLVLKSNRYNEAIQRFNRLLKLYPKGQYAQQAYYWLGESYDAAQQTMQALQSFQHVVQHYPSSTKHAASMLKLSQLYLKISKNKKGKETLLQLIQTYPKSIESQKAKKLLKP